MILATDYFLDLVQLTNNTKDTQDVRSEDDQQVDENEQRDGDSDVARPVEGFVGERHLLDGSPHLIRIVKKPLCLDAKRQQMMNRCTKLLTGKSTIGTVSVTAVSTATRTHRIKVSYGLIRL